MAISVISGQDVYRLAQDVAASGKVPVGGVTWKDGFWFQSVTDAAPGQDVGPFYIVAEADDVDFAQTAAGITDASPLGEMLQVDGLFVQSFGTVAETGGGGGGSTSFVDYDYGSGIVLPTANGGPNGLVVIDGDVGPGVQFTKNHNLSQAMGSLSFNDDGFSFNVKSQIGPVLTRVANETAMGYGSSSSTLGKIGISNTQAYVQYGAVKLQITGSQILMGNNVGSGPRLQMTSGLMRFLNGDLSLEQNLIPVTNNAQTLGTATQSWQAVYANGVALTSDARLKDEIVDIPNKVLDAWARVKFWQYNMIEDRTGRVHFGVLAQDIITAFQAEGLDALEYAIVTHDVWEAVPPATIEQWNPETQEFEQIVIAPGIPAGDRYSVNYNEALVLECALIRRGAANV